MIVSKCCSWDVFVANGDSNLHYYVCEKCELACDAMCSFDLEGACDARNEKQAFEKDRTA